MKRFKRIVCVIDPEHPSDVVIRRAVALAADNRAVLTLVAVVPALADAIGNPFGGPGAADLQDTAIAGARQPLEDIVERDTADVTVDVRVLIGTPFLEIIREVLRYSHDLLLKAPEDPAWTGRLFGSEDMHLLRKCPCPVWLVRQGAPVPFRRILATVNVDDDYPGPERPIRHQLNVKILELASSLALSDAAELHVVHCWQFIGEGALRGPFLHRPQTEIDRFVDRARRQHARGLDALVNSVVGPLRAGPDTCPDPSTHLVKGPAASEIPALAKSLDADLIVMGTVARTGIAGLLMGNTAEEILGEIGCSVLAVKPEGFQTPVALAD
jgi:nucleotide-binding universal stress UspA family protein